MAKNNNIPQGYKDSPLGIIPKEWEVKRLGEICTHFQSGMSITSKQITKQGIYSVYGGNGLRGYSDKYTHDGTYVLIGRQGALCGNINYVEGKNYISEHAIAVQTLGDIRWLKYKLDFWNLNKFSESSAQPGLSVEKLVRYKLTVPPIAEQQKIAEILSVWDNAIELQTKLIAQLEIRKRALMQQLLTGKRRLKGFSEKWKLVKLGDVADIKKGTALTSNEIEDGIYPVIAGGKTSPYKHNQYTDDNVITISASGAYAGYVAYHNYKIWASDCSVLYAKEQNSIEYLFQLLVYNQDYIYSLQSGGAQPHIFPRDIAGIKWDIPPYDEQKAIAKILVEADEEIIFAKQKFAILKEQKKGLMQQLLTGKKRVKL
jgi:type I restriction enzyme S subunit